MPSNPLRLRASRSPCDHGATLPAPVHPAVAEIALVSARLRKEREMAFYGEIDLIPGRSYDEEAARLAVAGTDRILALLGHFS